MTALQRLVDRLIDGDRNDPNRANVQLDSITALVCPGIGSMPEMTGKRFEPEYDTEVCIQCGLTLQHEKMLIGDNEDCEVDFVTYCPNGCVPYQPEETKDDIIW
jgi:hypothetical protein